MNADRIAALVALIAALLAGTGLPSKLGMTAQLVTVVGGLIVGFAAVGRAAIEMIAAWRHNEKVRANFPANAEHAALPVAPNWRDIVGAFLGVMAIGLGIEGVAVDQLDPDTLAGLSSIAAMAFAWQRGGGGPTPTLKTLASVLFVLSATAFCGSCLLHAATPVSIVATVVRYLSYAIILLVVAWSLMNARKLR